MTRKRQLGPAGRALKRALDQELGAGVEPLEWNAREAALIKTAAELADRLDAVNRVLDEEGLTVTTSKGDTRPHPLLNEQRQLSAALAKVVGSVQLPAEGPARSPLSVKRSRAARSRWDRRGY